jgi:hypothetical protein
LKYRHFTRNGLRVKSPVINSNLDFHCKAHYVVAMNTGAKLTLALVALIILVLVFPFNVTVAPEWKVKVVDEDGKPLAGAYVSEFASHGTLDIQHNESMCTDVNGEAQFGHRTGRASLLTRISRWVSRFNIHGGLGPYVAVGVDRLGYGDIPTQAPMPNFNGLMWYGSPSRMNSRVILHQCPKGFTGYNCGFEYDYFLSVNSTARKIASCLSAH